MEKRARDEAGSRFGGESCSMQPTMAYAGQDAVIVDFDVES